MEKDIARCMSYDPATGDVVWKEKFSVHSRRVKLGSAVGTQDRYGYLIVHFRERGLLVHRIAWLLHYGQWPEGDIDHINGVKTDNRIENLRVGTRASGNHNKGVNRLNSSGFRGVSWDSDRRKWAAQIKIDGKNKRLGRFKDVEDASRAYEAAAKIVHGEFYRPMT